MIHSSTVVMFKSKTELDLRAEEVMMSAFLKSVYTGQSTTYDGVQRQHKHVYSLTRGLIFSTS